MALAMDTLVYDGITFGSRYEDLHFGAGVTGFGTGMNRLALTDRMSGGQHLGSSTLAAMTLDVDFWASDMSKLQALRARMGATASVLPLRWRGLGWGDGEFVAWVTPAGVAWRTDSWSIKGYGIVPKINASWVAPDPTVYDAEPTEFTGTASSSAPFSQSWTNPGDSTPPHGLGGRAWILEAKASGAVRGVWIDQGPGTERVEFRGVIVPSGSMLVVGADRVPTVRSAAGAVVPVVAWSRHAGQWVPDPVWPRFAPGVASRLRIGCTAGSLAVEGEFRGTW